MGTILSQKDSSDIPEYEALKSECDVSEFESLPKTFNQFWEGIVVEYRKHSTNFVSAAKKVKGLDVWKSLDNLYPTARVLYETCEALQPSFTKKCERVYQA